MAVMLLCLAAIVAAALSFVDKFQPLIVVAVIFLAVAILLGSGLG